MYRDAVHFGTGSSDRVLHDFTLAQHYYNWTTWSNTEQLLAKMLCVLRNLSECKSNVNNTGIQGVNSIYKEH